MVITRRNSLVAAGIVASGIGLSVLGIAAASSTVIPTVVSEDSSPAIDSPVVAAAGGSDATDLAPVVSEPTTEPKVVSEPTSVPKSNPAPSRTAPAPQVSSPAASTPAAPVPKPPTTAPTPVAPIYVPYPTPTPTPTPLRTWTTSVHLGATEGVSASGYVVITLRDKEQWVCGSDNVIGFNVRSTYVEAGTISAYLSSTANGGTVEMLAVVELAPVYSTFKPGTEVYRTALARADVEVTCQERPW